MTTLQIKQQALALKPQERLRLVQDIWDSLVEESASVRISEHHRRLINQRLAEHSQNPQAAITLAEAQSRIRKHLADKRKK
ncbi:MAG TPA: addiction module protein [Tepidisphaeraceae bacterium]|nr:addiction module protein [Tepidisphaeraceae bacterium]